MAQLIKALRYEPVGRGLDSRDRSGCTLALGLTQTLTEMSTTNITLGVKTAGAYG